MISILLFAIKGLGSFTGIRIGLASAKAMAEVYNIPIVSVSSLDSLAYNVEFNGNICSIIDAKNNQVYMGLYDCNRKILSDYIADDINTCINIINKFNSNFMFVGDGSIVHKNLLATNFKSNSNFSTSNTLNAFAFSRCGLDKFNSGFVENSDNVLPMYLRKSQAERMKDINGN